jgi:tagatose 6-phosphate kinase
MDAMLRQKGVPTDFTWVGGETRLNTVIVSADGSAQTTITVDTLKVSQAHVEEFLRHYREAIIGAKCITISGSLPKGVPVSFYTDLIEEAHYQHKPIILDASGINLKTGFASRPTMIKPNREELEQLYGQPCPTIEAVLLAGRELLDKNGTIIVVTLGVDGAVAVLPERAYRIPAIKVKVASPAGAGDAVVAGLAAGLACGDTLEEGLRLAFAAAGAAVMMPGTADIRKEDVDALLPMVELTPL